MKAITIFTIHFIHYLSIYLSIIRGEAGREAAPKHLRFREREKGSENDEREGERERDDIED